jgi:hypothetical protein
MLPFWAVRHVFGVGLQRRASQHLGGRLGGDWNTRGQGPIGSWAQRLAPLRHRVVHSGYVPTRKEAREAVTIVASVDNHVKVRLADNRTRYMRTTLLAVGEPRLKREGLWEGELKRFAEQADEEPAWIPMFLAWREQLLQARGLAT